MSTNAFPRAFSPLGVGESVPLRFNFTRLTLAPTLPQFTVTWLRGTPDPDPNVMKVGAPYVVGPRAFQQMQGLVDGADYLLECFVTDGANRWRAAGEVRVRAR